MHFNKRNCWGNLWCDGWNTFKTTNPWTMHTSVGVDNTFVNVVLDIHWRQELSRGGRAFARCCGFDAEEFAVDLYYWFDKSTKRKNELKSYNEFCNQEYRSMIKHVSTRWLTLELAIERSLKQYHGLNSYFLLRTNHKQDSIVFKLCLVTLWLKYISFFFNLYSQCSIMPTIKFLQREEPLIHILQKQLYSLLKKCFRKICPTNSPSRKYTEGNIIGTRLLWPKYSSERGSHYSLDWTTGLDYWTGLLDSPKMV